MKIKKKHKGHIHIIIGASRFGARIATKKAKEGKYVTVIDNDPNAVYKLGDNFPGAFVLGDASKLSILKEAEIDNAKEILICTDNDDTNIYLANVIYKIFNKDRIVIRIDDESKHNLLLSEKFRIINPFVSSMMQFIEFDDED